MSNLKILFVHSFIDVVLELEPRYLKAVMRRAQALEALEKYEDALEGVCVYVHACVSVHAYSDTANSYSIS